MILGFLGLVYGFWNSPSTISEAQQMVAVSDHGGGHDSEILDHEEEASSEIHAEENHESEHGEHLFHQLQNRPWAALYVAALFFFMIPLGVLAFYAICLLYTSPSPRDRTRSRMPSSA